MTSLTALNTSLRRSTPMIVSQVLARDQAMHRKIERRLLVDDFASGGFPQQVFNPNGLCPLKEIAEQPLAPQEVVVNSAIRIDRGLEIWLKTV